MEGSGGWEMAANCAIILCNFSIVEGSGGWKCKYITTLLGICPTSDDLLCIWDQIIEGASPSNEIMQRFTP